jgi:hypothetical protein
MGLVLIFFVNIVHRIIDQSLVTFSIYNVVDVNIMFFLQVAMTDIHQQLHVVFAVKLKREGRHRSFILITVFILECLYIKHPE